MTTSPDLPRTAGVFRGCWVPLPRSARLEGIGPHPLRAARQYRERRGVIVRPRRGARKRQSPDHWSGLRVSVQVSQGSIALSPAVATGAAAGTGTVLAGLRLVDRQGAALVLGTTERGDGLVAPVAHLD